MCLRPIKISNPSGNLHLYGQRVVQYDAFYRPQDAAMYVPCRKCPECIEKRLKEYRNRCKYEIFANQNTHLGLFVTLSFASDSGFFDGDLTLNLSKAVRQFSEKLRLRFGTFKRIFIPEFGDNGNRIHLHSLLFFDKNNKKQMSFYNEILSYKVYHHSLNSGFFSPVLFDLWEYGLVHVGEEVSMRTANYISKYFTKSKTIYKDKPLFIYCSNNFGKVLEAVPFELYEQIYDYFKYICSDDHLNYLRSLESKLVKFNLKNVFRHEYESDGKVYFIDFRISFKEFREFLCKKLHAKSHNLIVWFETGLGMVLDSLEQIDFNWQYHNPVMIRSRDGLRSVKKYKIDCLTGEYYSYCDVGEPSILKKSDKALAFLKRNTLSLCKPKCS